MSAAQLQLASDSFVKIDPGSEEGSGNHEVSSFEEVEYEYEETEEDALVEEGTENEDNMANASPVEPHDEQAMPSPEHERQATEDVNVPPSATAEAESSAVSGHAENPRTQQPEEEPAGTSEPSTVELTMTTASLEASPTKQLGAEYDFKELEAQAAKVAKDVQEVAKDVTKKLSSGLQSALGAVNATSSLNKLAGGLSSWWNSLDPPQQQQRNEQEERVQNATKASSDLQELFGLAAEENLVESFKCKLLQTYACNHNNWTPAIQMAFQGTMYITDKHTCFSVEERGRKLPFKVAHVDVMQATRQRPQRKGDLSDILHLDIGNAQFLAFKDFESSSALDSALALVEHLMEG